LDSALVLALASAIFYAAGYLERLSDASFFRLPYSLMPKEDPEELIVNGFLLFLIICLVGSLIIALVILIYKLALKLMPDKMHEDTVVSLKKRFKQHKIFYTYLILLIVATLYWDFCAHPPVQHKNYMDGVLPSVLELQVKEPTKLTPGDWRFFSMRDGWIVLKRANTSQFMMLKADNVLKLALSIPER
jgi:hypothetical protein